MEIITFYLPLVSSIYMFWVGIRVGPNRRETQQDDSTDRAAGIELMAMTSPAARGDSF